MSDVNLRSLKLKAQQMFIAKAARNLEPVIRENLELFRHWLGREVSETELIRMTNLRCTEFAFAVFVDTIASNNKHSIEMSEFHDLILKLADYLTLNKLWVTNSPLITNPDGRRALDLYHTDRLEHWIKIVLLKQSSFPDQKFILESAFLKELEVPSERWTETLLTNLESATRNIRIELEAVSEIIEDKFKQAT